MNRRRNATEITTLREEALMRLINGELLLQEDIVRFPCREEALGDLYRILHEKEPAFIKCVKVGGLGNHKDLQIILPDAKKGVEIKISEKKISEEKLDFEPWEGGVQFLQGQILSESNSRFLGDLSAPMVAAWFEKVKGLLAIHLPTFTVPTLNDYSKVIFTIGSEKKMTTPAAKLIQHLRSNDGVRQLFQDAWLQFEDEYFASHSPDLVAFQQDLDKKMSEKDYWININKAGAFFIEGFRVIGLRYVGIQKKPRGGTVFRYKMTIQKKNRGDSKDVPIVLKFSWRNGGQGVQNINLMVVSDTFKE